MMKHYTKQLGIRVIALALVIGALLIGGVTITRAAALVSIPGDALYPVKTAIEQTRLTLAQDAGDRAQMKISFADQRLEEIAALIESGRYHLVGEAVLAFEADINSAILELETIAGIDPVRASRIALEITSALTRYAQTLSIMASNAPDSVRQEVTRALDSTQIAAGLELPASSLGGDDDNANSNGNDDNANSNSDDDSANSNGDDDSANSNGDDDNANSNGDDDNANSNGDDDNANSNGDDDNANSNGDDDNANSNGIDDNANSNDDDSANSNGDDDSANSNDDDSANSNDNGANSNDNGDGHGGNSGSGSGSGSNDNGDDSSGGGNDNGDDNSNDD